MNAFKKKSLCLAIAAGLGTVGMAGTASAVNINSNGLGQALIYPYFSVRSGLNTYVSVVNTTNSAKAVKVRFLEGRNSREVLDFNLYLSARDVWTAVLVKNSTDTGGKLITTDKSCTAPAIPAGGVDFVNYAYSGAVVAGFNPGLNGMDGVTGSDTLDRSKEGYFEIIEMGVITNPTILTGITHVNGVPANCGVVTQASATAANGMTTIPAGTFPLAPPSGGLAGTGSLVNPAVGTAAGYDAIALAAFSTSNIWAPPGSLQPNLTQASPARSVVFKNGAAITSTWTAGNGFPDAVTSVLMHDNLINEYVLDVGTLSATDWVVTMPTKRYYVPVQPTTGTVYTAQPPFTSKFWITGTSPWAGGACEPVTLQYWDREEQTQTPSTPQITFSPLPTIPTVAGPSLCWETTVLAFGNSATTATPSLLGSANSVPMPITTPAAQNGWLRISFTAAGQTMTSNVDLVNGQHTFVGLPVVGFMIRDFINSATPNSNYAGNFAHKTTTLIDGSSAD